LTSKCVPCDKLKKTKVIWPYYLHFGLSHATVFAHTLLCTKSIQRNSGLFKYGHGKKSVISYWKFNVKKGNLLEFHTVAYKMAKEIYKKNKPIR